MYHSIDETGSPISIDPRAFRQHMEFLARGRPRVIPLRDIATHAAPDETVAITFDDGFANFVEFAVPLLEDLGLPTTMFVVTDHVGGTNAWQNAAGPKNIPILPLMSWDALQRIARGGVEIGSHTRRHARLTTVDDPGLVEELEGAADRLQRELGARPTSFAYPYGDLDHRVMAAVRRTYLRACTTELRALEVGADCARLPRLDAYYLRAPGRLEEWGSPAFQRHLWLRAQARRVRRFVAAAAERN